VKHIQIDGFISNMDFLYPGPEDSDHVILILVVKRSVSPHDVESLTNPRQT
jgi:hypothetical protein